MKKQLIAIAKAAVIVIVINSIATYFHYRIDLTEDQRYTLSEPAITIANEFNRPVIVDVLLEGNLPTEFARLRSEVQLILEEFAFKNPHIKYNFVDPLKNNDKKTVIAELQGLGLTPASVTTTEDTKVSQEVVFPWAMVHIDNNTIKVPLLKNKLGATTTERITNSIQHLEYAFADAFSKVLEREKKSVAVIKGNGELADIKIADYLTSIRDYYNIGVITLDSVNNNAQKTLDQLNGFDVAIIAKPTEAFTDQEKFVMDQYIVNGGKTLWLVDPVAMELDSLFNETGSNTAYPRRLNLDDFFFKYGVRLNSNLVNDLYFTQIVLATGDNNNAEYNPVPWVYHPMVISKNNHAINNNIEALRFQFTSSIDTLENPYKKTILYQSSSLSKVESTPITLNLDLVNKAPNKESYIEGNYALAVLIEGAFSSVYKNRIKPLKLKKHLDDGPKNKMIVISDGDLIKNQISKGRPLALGYDKWTNNQYGNKEFLINSLNYLLDDTGLINIRTKKVSITFLDQKKIGAQKTKFQLLNIGLPVVLLLLFGLGFNWYRRKKYNN